MGIIRVYNFHHLAYRFALRNQIFFYLNGATPIITDYIHKVQTETIL